MKAYVIFSASALITFLTCILAGYEWVTGVSTMDALQAYQIETIFDNGFPYAASMLLFITFHEFGHYFTARYYQVKSSLPFYIPLWIGGLSIGTLGAIIRIKEPIISRKIFFDVGIAGPLAGYIIALGLLFYGYSNLPDKSDIYNIHPEYQYFGEHWDDIVYKRDTFMVKKDYQKLVGTWNYTQDTVYLDKDTPVFKLGKSATMLLFETYVADKDKLMPSYEIMHNPWLLAGFFALLFTALNLFPVGQLDGGHVLYGLVNIKTHSLISEGVLIFFVFFSGFGLFSPHSHSSTLGFFVACLAYVGILRLVVSSFRYSSLTKWQIAIGIFTVQYFLKYFFPNLEGEPSWFLFSIVLGKFLGVYHPQARIEKPLDIRRKILAVLALIIFFISFIPYPIDQGLEPITFPQLIDFTLDLNK